MRRWSLQFILPALVLYFFRVGMFANMVHIAEFIKAVRLIAGVDTLRPERLLIIPRLPGDVNSIKVEDYPVAIKY